MSVLSYITDCASQEILTQEEADSINTSFSTITERMLSYFDDEVKEIIPFGSFTRDTILPRVIDDNSDVDLMIVFKNSNIKPQAYLDRLRKFVETTYSRSEIYQSNPTIVLKLNHIKFDLVPALKNLSAFPSYSYKIPAPKSSYINWLETNPVGFNQKLTRVNNSQKNMIKPLIRLVKYWNAFNGYIFDSFEIEKTIVDKSWCADNLKGYLFQYFKDLSTLSIFSNQNRSDKITNAKKIIQNVELLERNKFPEYSEMEIQHLLPLFWE